jgi:hypothetical protein
MPVHCLIVPLSHQKLVCETPGVLYVTCIRTCIATTCVSAPSPCAFITLPSLLAPCRAVIQLYVLGVVLGVVMAFISHPWFYAWLLPRIYPLICEYWTDLVTPISGNPIMV